jgi:hypothetical protein
VTDAMHMPRSRAAFERAGLDVVSAPTMFFGNQARSLGAWVPSAEGMRRSWYAIYELLGLAWYKLRWHRRIHRFQHDGIHLPAVAAQHQRRRTERHPDDADALARRAPPQFVQRRMHAMRFTQTEGDGAGRAGALARQVDQERRIAVALQEAGTLRHLAAIAAVSMQEQDRALSLALEQRTGNQFGRARPAATRPACSHRPASRHAVSPPSARNRASRWRRRRAGRRQGQRQGALGAGRMGSGNGIGKSAIKSYLRRQIQRAVDPCVGSPAVTVS